MSYRINCENQKYIALDCEFATRKDIKNENIVISITIVDYNGSILLNTLIEPKCEYFINKYQYNVHGILKY